MQPALQQCMTDASCTPADIDAIAVTSGPGLLGSLLVGTTTARVLSALWNKPLIGVHHTLGHLSAPWLTPPESQDLPSPTFPALALSASGGHTELWLRHSHTANTLLGATRDDAAGEAFDKGAALLGLPYPGGPAIARAAESGDALAFAFPDPLGNKDTLDFSFSGLKTALRYTLRDHGIAAPIPEAVCADLAASYQEAICRHLVHKISRALQQYPTPTVHIVGGVSANTRLRTLLTETLPATDICIPVRIAYCTDNAAMIAAAGYFLHAERGDSAFAPFVTEASSRLPQQAIAP